MTIRDALEVAGVTMYDVYGMNAEKLDNAITRFNLVTDIVGPVGIETRERAVSLLVDIKTYLGTDRLELNDYMAVVPNYIAQGYDNDAESVTYRVGFELVMRDFRNWEMLNTRLGYADDPGRRKYIEHPTGKKIPIAEPSLKVRVFDIPIGLLYGFILDKEHGEIYLMANRKKDLNCLTLRFRVGTVAKAMDRIAMEKVAQLYEDDMPQGESAPDDTIQDESYGDE